MYITGSPRLRKVCAIFTKKTLLPVPPLPHSIMNEFLGTPLGNAASKTSISKLIFSTIKPTPPINY